jgi:hypothetical protein
MKSTRWLLTLIALGEAGTGIALLLAPSLVIWALLGVRDPGFDTLVVARVCGAGLAALGIACWFARSARDGSALRGLLLGLVVYNIGVAAVLGHAGWTHQPIGAALWPVAIVHVLLGAWCLACARPGS